jgi:peptidoglycan/LPS O-acetylase OafA/YrhL
MARSDVRPSTVDPSIEPAAEAPAEAPADAGADAAAAAIGNSDVQAEVRASGPHIGGLDGIRAIAVIGVLGFHAGVRGFGGGLLGVDIFFVLSGFLITSLLLDEWSATGTVSFRRFYERRARRLLPGLFLLLLLVAAYAQWFAETDTLSTLRGDALSTILYVANWRFIFSGQSYFVHFGPPSPLLHTWSLAVEEQFYLVWPAVALFVLRRRGRRGLAVAASIFMVASAVLTAVLLRDGVSVSRLYYGTDTRTQELMAGAVLAVVAPLIARNRRAWRWPVTVLGGLGALFLLWALHSVSGQGNFLYEGGWRWRAPRWFSSWWSSPGR